MANSFLKRLTCNGLGLLSFVLLQISSVAAQVDAATTAGLRVGIQAVDITPEVEEGTPVWLAGYGWGRKATGVRDKLYARAIVLHDAESDKRVALVSVDLVGMQLPQVTRIREALSEFDYVMVSSTHNHEGPDTIGIWGRTPFHRGVNPQYLEIVVQRTVDAVRQAEKRLKPAVARYGTARDETLVDDNRKPIVKDDVLRLIAFESLEQNGDKLIAMLVQWNCHPEAMGSKNTLVTADFCCETVRSLESRHRCPVAYFTGAVGGLMAPPDDRFKDEEGRILKEGEFEYTDAYGKAVANLANAALDNAKPIQLVPFKKHIMPVAIPVENALYRTARIVGVVRRQAVKWTGDFHDVEKAEVLTRDGQYAVGSEVGFLKLGELAVGCIPGELYPELVYGEFQEPVEPNADFPQAPLEPHVTKLFGEQPWLLMGLANDEIGYIIPRRQWDAKPPHAYGRTKPQYGEVNSCGPQVAPIVMQALQECVAEVHRAATP